MKRHAYIAAALFAAVPAIGFAQTFNPKVVITNAYDGKVMEVQKQEMEMVVPDSLSHFDLAFDYSVFDNPYTGSYEFTPYEMCFTPEMSPYNSSSLYLRGGLGFTLHPELQAVYTPSLKGPFTMSVYDDFKGYLGNYRNLEAQGGELGEWTIGERASDPYSGYDLTNRFGVRGIKKGKTSDFGFDANYGLLASSDTIVTHMANSLNLDLSLASNYDIKDGIFCYDAGLGISYLNDNFCGSHLSQIGADFDFSVSAELTDRARIVVDFNEDLVKHDKELESFAGITRIVPKFEWNTSRVALGVGIAATLNMKGTDNTYAAGRMYKQTAQFLTPQLDFTFRLIPDYMAFYAYAGGGTYLNTYASILSSHHMVDPFGCLQMGKFLDYSVTQLDAGAGFKGCVAGGLQYDVKAGWGSYDNVAMDAIVAFREIEGTPLRACIAYADYTAFYTDLNLRWKSVKFEADAYFRYQQTDCSKLNGVVAPADFKGLAHVKYHFSDRLSFGVSGEYMSARTQTTGIVVGDPVYIVPAFFDLGVFADYRLTSKLSLWAKGGNLLGQNIQRTVLYSEKGLIATVGACLNF